MIKDLIKSGQYGQTENGTKFTVLYIKGMGYQLLFEGGDMQPLDNWTDTLGHTTNPYMDIVLVMSPEGFDTSAAIWDDVNFSDEVKELATIWAYEGEPETPSETILVEFDVKINGNPVDLDNMSQAESAVMVSFYLQLSENMKRTGQEPADEDETDDYTD